MSERFAKTGGRRGGKTIAALSHLAAVIAEYEGAYPLVISLDRQSWEALKDAIREETLDWSPVLMRSIDQASDSSMKFTACGITFLIRDHDVDRKKLSSITLTNPNSDEP